MKVERQEVLSRGGEHAQAPAQTAAFLEQLCGDMEAVLVNTNAGVDESRSLLPHLKAFADVVAGSGCQPAIPGVPTSRPETLGKPSRNRLQAMALWAMASSMCKVVALFLAAHCVIQLQPVEFTIVP